jgi:CBS-domain-containing membrane protein
MEERRNSMLYSIIIAFISLFILVYFVFVVSLSICLFSHNLSFLIGSLTRRSYSSVGHPDSPLAQLRNVIGDHFLSAIVECAWRVAIDRVHPPGRATALIVNNLSKHQKYPTW